MAIFEPHMEIGGYELLRLLGEGGMGEVWLARDKRADRFVALKFIKPHLLNDPGFRARFSHEAKTLGKLEHDRIVTLYAVLDEGEYLALVLRFIDGNSLADKIDAQGALALPFVLSCARDILPALGFAHENGIIHRDIKPPNILVDSRDRCFLMDFGIAVAEFAERGTMTGLAIGTPHYMSPEQIRTPREITIPLRGHRTDIYSFGVVLFEMLSGQVPFGQHSGVEDMFSIQSAHCNEPPPPLREINPTVPRAVEEVVMACLEKDPANRPQTCIELLGQLEAAALSGGQSVRAHPPTIVEPRKSALSPLRLGWLQFRRWAVNSFSVFSGDSGLTQPHVNNFPIRSNERDLNQGSVSRETGTKSRRLNRTDITHAAPTQVSAQSIKSNRHPTTSDGQKMCPKCSSLLQSYAIGCSHCGTVLDDRASFDLHKTRGTAIFEASSASTSGFLLRSDLVQRKVSLVVARCSTQALSGHATSQLDHFPFTVGRNSADLNLTFDPEVSDKHFAIDLEDGRFTVRDLKSRNGTFLNGRRLKTTAKLLFGAEISIGRTVLVFRADEINEIPDLTDQCLNARFSFIERLHYSMNSVIYRAEDLNLRRTVAIKILSPSLAAHPGYSDQFLKEVHIAGKLQHPNIARIIEGGLGSFESHPGDQFYFVCREFFEGVISTVELDRERYSRLTKRCHG